MNNIKDNFDCCGCSACINICPKKCISFKQDKEGFDIPHIDENQCINCGMCVKVCPTITITARKNIDDIVVYACKNKSTDIRLNSSSGGVFYSLAKEIIGKDGVVFGVRFNDNFEAICDYCDNLADIKKFQGSKYVQCKMQDSFEKAKEFLQNGRIVLFTGTPCTINGLKNFLGKDYDNLYLVDVVCMGVPSPAVWEKYKSFISNNNTLKISEISFRNKSSGWKNYSFCATFDNGEVLCETNSQNAYLKAFTKVLLNRKSCESCKSKDFKISSDITLGDYWGIESSFKDVIIDNKGYSMVLVNSAKGSYLFNSIKDNLDVMQSSIEDVIIKQPTLTRSAVSSENRDKFFKQVNNSKNIQKLLLKYGKLSFKEFSKKGIRYINKRILKKKGND